VIAVVEKKINEKHFHPEKNTDLCYPTTSSGMRHVTVYTTNKEYQHFIELAKNLQYVKKIETDEEPTKEEIINNLKAGFEEVKLIKKGKLKTTSLQDFLNEL
jgi:uncharacterized protein YlbG (UPF0298 family)